MSSASNPRLAGALGLPLAVGLFVLPVITAATPDQPSLDRIRQDLRVRQLTVQPLVLPTGNPEAVAVDVVIDGSTERLELHRHSVRAPDFRIHVQDGTGSRLDVEPPPVRTYRGDGATTVAGALRDGQLTALLRRADGTIWHVHPVGDVLADADPSLHAVYRDQDIIAGDWSCGAGAAAERDGAPAPGGGSGAATDITVARIAYDADVEFYELNNSSVEDTVADIEAVTNGVNAIYEAEASITHQIVTVVVRSSEPDPYTTTDHSDLLGEFRSHWNDNFDDVQRDTAHLMTGKDLDGSVIGVAYVGVICTGSSSRYGLSQSRFISPMPNRVGLTAHEIGHNWDASHCWPGCSDPGDPDCAIMCPCISGCSGTLDMFGVSATAEIIAHRDSVTCLGPLAPPGAATEPVPGNGTAGAFTNALLGWAAGSQASTHDVYFGTNPQPGPAEFQGSQLTTTFDPGPLATCTTYYWKVDEVNGVGMTPGPVWSFTTGNEAAPAFMSIATTETTDSESFPIDTPAGTSEGDLLIAVVSKESDGELFTPAGWTLIDEGPAEDNKARLGVFSRVAGPSEPDSYTFTADENKKAVGAIIRYCCADLDAPIDVSTFAVDKTESPTAPGVTTTVDGAMVVRIFGAKDDDLAGNPYPVGHDGRFAMQSGGKISGGAADVRQAAAGPTGTASFDLTDSREWRAVTVGLAAVPAEPCDTCPADLNGDGAVDVLDFLTLLGAWGGPGGDVNGDGTTDVLDFLSLLSLWGPCP